MPIYDCRLNVEDWITQPPVATIPSGAEPFPRFNGLPGELRDATGQKLLWVVRCNTETGEVEQYERINGKFSIDPKTKRVLGFRVKYAAPLTYTATEPKPITLQGTPTPSGVKWMPYVPPKLPSMTPEQEAELKASADKGAIHARRLWFRKKVDTVTGFFNCTDLTAPPDEPDTPIIVGG